METTRQQPIPTMTLQMEKSKKERTLLIIKPDATARHLENVIIAHLEKHTLHVLKRLRLRLSPSKAEAFYAIHSARPFFQSLINYMTSGEVDVCLVEGIDAVARVRNLMGTTDPAKAQKGTIRQKYGEDVERNSIHGSDSEENARREIAFFQLD